VRELRLTREEEQEEEMIRIMKECRMKEGGRERRNNPRSFGMFLNLKLEENSSLAYFGTVFSSKLCRRSLKGAKRGGKISIKKSQC
jgi:hypothetical protein